MSNLNTQCRHILSRCQKTLSSIWMYIGSPKSIHFAITFFPVGGGERIFLCILILTPCNKFYGESGPHSSAMKRLTPLSKATCKVFHKNTPNKSQHLLSNDRGAQGRHLQLVIAACLERSIEKAGFAAGICTCVICSGKVDTASSSFVYGKQRMCQKYM